MIEAIPKHFFSNSFVLFDENRSVGEFDMSLWREKAEFEIGGVGCRLYREKLFAGAFVLESAGSVLVRAVKPSMLRNLFRIELGESSFTLRKLSFWKRQFGLFDGERQIGSISPAGLLTRRVLIDLPADWPSAVQIFLLWLVLVIWNRDAAAAAS